MHAEDVVIRPADVLEEGLEQSWVVEEEEAVVVVWWGGVRVEAEAELKLQHYYRFNLIMHVVHEL